MDGDSVIRISTLRTVVNGILDFIEKDLAMSEVELGKDHYWEIIDRYLLDEPRPEQFGAGSLIDDCGFVEVAATDREQQLPILLAHVAPILHALSHAVPSYKVVNDKTEY